MQITSNPAALMSLSVCILYPCIYRGWGFIFQSPREWSLHGANFYRAIQASKLSFQPILPAFVTGEDFCFFTLWEKTPSSHFLCARLLRKLTLSSLWVFLIALSPRPQMETWLRLARFVPFSILDVCFEALRPYKLQFSTGQLLGFAFAAARGGTNIYLSVNFEMRSGHMTI